MSAGLSNIPALDVRLGDQSLDPAVLASLVAMRVRRELGCPAQCELTWCSSGSPANLHLSTGAALHVSLRGQGVALFSGEVTAWEREYGSDGRLVTRVRGYDRLHRLRQRHQLRAHVRVTAEQLARELTADLGLEVRSAWEGPRWPHWIQRSDDDLALLTEVAERAGLYANLDEGILWLDGLVGRGEPSTLEWGVDLLEGSFEVNGDRACAAVTAHCWSPLAAGHGKATARVPRHDRGPTASPEKLRGDRDQHILNVASVSEDHAAALAQAELDRRRAAEVILRGTALGDPRLTPGRPVRVGGVEQSLCGRYVLTAVVHQIDGERGFVSQISTEPPASSARTPRGDAVVTTGLVTRVADPERRGRVCVRLPAYGDVETDWMRVAAPGAGSSKGLVALPDVDDEVLVVLADAHPSAGVVLAGVFGASGPQDPGVEGEGVERFTLASGGGHRILLDEGTGVLSLETAGGSRIEMGRDLMRVHAETDLVVEAPGRHLVFRAALVDFERA